MDHNTCVGYRSKSSKKIYEVGIRFVLTIYALIITFLGALIYLDEKKTIWFFREDGVIETLTFLFLLVSSGIMLYLWWQLRERSEKAKAKRWYLLLGMLFLFGAMEEISWGQRLFNYQIEFVQNVNIQDETNFHNLKFFRDISAISPWLEVISHPDRMFTLFMFLLTIFIPLGTTISTFVRQVVHRMQLPVTSWAVSLACLLSFVLPELLDQVSEGPWLHHVFKELQESMFTLTLVLFSIQERHRQVTLAMLDASRSKSVALAGPDSDTPVD